MPDLEELWPTVIGDPEGEELKAARAEVERLLVERVRLLEACGRAERSARRWEVYGWAITTLFGAALVGGLCLWAWGGLMDDSQNMRSLLRCWLACMSEPRPSDWEQIVVHLLEDTAAALGLTPEQGAPARPMPRELETEETVTVIVRPKGSDACGERSSDAGTSQ